MNALVILAAIAILAVGWIVIRTGAYRTTVFIVTYGVCLVLTSLGASRLNRPPLAPGLALLIAGVAGILVLTVALLTVRSRARAKER